LGDFWGSDIFKVQILLSGGRGIAAQEQLQRRG